MRFRGALSASSLTLLLACGSDGPSGPPQGTVEFILVGPNSPIRLPPGVPLTIQLQVLDKDANFLALPPRTAFTWESSDPSVATVNRTGVVLAQPTAVPGTETRIKVSYGRAFESVYVDAATRPVALHFSPSTPTVTPGAQLVLRGLAETPQGELEPSHLIEFTLTAGSGFGHLSPTHPNCGFAGCVAVEPDAVTVTTESPGVMTVKAAADGKSATTDLTVRTVSFTDMIAGTGHTCGRTPDGQLFCWGHQFLGTPIQVAVPQGVGGQLWAGATVTCGIDGAHHAQCWPDSPNPLAEPVSTSIMFSRLAPGGTSSCGLDLSGSAWCWGVNQWGQLGDGTKTFSVAPVAVLGGLQFEQITTSLTDEDGHACALTPSGAAYCWGANYAGQ
jgi:hypothetical protein